MTNAGWNSVSYNIVSIIRQGVWAMWALVSGCRWCWYIIYTNILYIVSLGPLVTSTAFSRPRDAMTPWRCEEFDRNRRGNGDGLRQTISARYSAIDGAEGNCCDGKDSDQCTDRVKTIISVLCIIGGDRRYYTRIILDEKRVSVYDTATIRRTMYLLATINYNLHYLPKA